MDKSTVEEIAPTILEIAQLKRDIKRRHKELKLGRELTEEQHVKHFKPLTEPLGEIVETLKAKSDELTSDSINYLLERGSQGHQEQFWS